MSTANRVFKNTLYLYVRMVVSIVFSFFTTRILLQTLGASDYGLYNVVAGALAMLGFLSSSMSSATQRFISYAEGQGDVGKIKEIFNNAVYLHRLMALFVCIFFVLGGLIFFNGLLNIPEGRTLVAITVYGCMIFSTVFAITIVPYDAVLNAHENMKYYSLLGIVDVIFKFIIAILVMSCSQLDRLLLYGILIALESWLFRFITQRYCIRHYSEVREINRTKYVKKNTIRTMTSFAGWNMLNISTGMISLYGMNIAINHFFGTVLNAAMGIANQLAGILMGVSSNMTKAMTPVLVKSEGGQNREKMIEISMIGCKYSYLLFSFFCIPVIFCLRPLLAFWLKDVPEWTELFCLLMLVSTLIEQMFVFLYQSINAQGNVRNFNIVRSILNILPIVVMTVEFSFGMPPYHALLDWIVFKVVGGGLTNLYYAHKNFDFPIKKFLKTSIIHCILSSLIIASVCYLLRTQPTDNIAIVFGRLIGMLVISIPIYWFVAVNQSEKQMFLSLLNKFKH